MIANFNINEITPIQTIKSSNKGLRLNILIPAISDRHMFGGISTAFRFFFILSRHFEDLRIIVIDEDHNQTTTHTQIDEFKKVSKDSADENGNIINFAENRAETKIHIRENDYFITTAWWTDILYDKINKDQNYFFPLVNKRKHIYIIQDYEPGFYPFSTRYALAESTYIKTEQTIALINSKFLLDFLKAQNYSFSDEFYFDPVINHDLKLKIKKTEGIKKEKVILIYGRPDTPRNCFEIIVDGLKLWASKNKQASDWQIISAGKAHEDINLSENVFLKSLGKLSIDQYGDLLLRAYCGISLMVSPHPSYPPLEMSAFKIKLITNKFNTRDLSLHLDDTICLEAVNSDSIFIALNKITICYDEESMLANTKHYKLNYLNDFVNRDSEFDNLDSLILKKLINQ